MLPVALICAVTLLGSCATASDAESAAPETPVTVTTTTSTSPSTTPPTTERPVSTGDVEGFDVARVSLDGEPLVVAVADTSELRGRGLMGVTDLGDLDGMLFSWGGEVVTSRFTMRNTLIPLTIAFFGPDGVLVDSLAMEPCRADPCATYGAAGPYAYAIEFPDAREFAAGTTLGLQSPP